jgi:hypothetical protein
MIVWLVIYLLSLFLLGASVEVIVEQSLGMDENQLIDIWLMNRGGPSNPLGINKYGDPSGTIYGGGTPLFNEVTGQRMSIHDYVKMRHPEKPWMAYGTTSTSTPPPPTRSSSR